MRKKVINDFQPNFGRFSKDDWSYYVFARLYLITDLKGGDKFFICKNINSVSITTVVELIYGVCL